MICRDIDVDISAHTAPHFHTSLKLKISAMVMWFEYLTKNLIRSSTYLVVFQPHLMAFLSEWSCLVVMEMVWFLSCDLLMEFYLNCEENHKMWLKALGLPSKCTCYETFLLLLLLLLFPMWGMHLQAQFKYVWQLHCIKDIYIVLYCFVWYL